MPENVQCSPNHPCTAVQLLTQELGQESERIDEVKKITEKLQNRLPLWATMAFAGCGTLIGFLSSHLKF
jgi:hypothetical protein